MTESPLGDGYDDGRAAYRRFDQSRRKAVVEDPLTSSFAEGVVDEFVERWRDSGIFGEALEGGRARAGEKHVEPLDALLELLQNADDQGATSATMVLRDRELLFVHDGRRVRLPDVPAIVMPYLTTKRDDAEAIGRFGIGLKTLVALGDDLAVHSRPYHFAARASGPDRVPPAAPIDGIYDGTAAQTLFVLTLRDETLEPDALHDWVEDLDAAGIVFLTNLTDLTLIAGGRRTSLHAGRRAQSTHAVDGRPVETSRVTGGGGWTVYARDASPPDDLVRSDKARDLTVTVGIAISNGADGGRICIGLPLERRTGMPASVHGPFDPDEARRDLRRTPWNEWLFDQLAVLVGDVVRLRYDDRPDRMWRAVPVSAEIASDHAWLGEQLGKIRTAAITALEELAFQPPDPEEETRGFAEAAVDPGWVSRLVGPELLTITRSGVVPEACRDRAGRWRRVLRDAGLGLELTAEDVLAIADADDENIHALPVSWWRQLTAGFVERGAHKSISQARVLVLDDGTRMAASDVDAGRILTSSATSAHVPVLTQLHPEFITGRGSREIVSWLQTSDRLVDAPSDEQILEALARWEGEALPLDDDALLWLHGAIWRMDESDRGPLSARIGSRVTVDGYRYVAGERTSVPVTIARAYLPNTITHQGDSFAKAAGDTVDLLWVDARYDKLLRADRSLGVGGALATFRLLGGRTTPPLEQPTAREDCTYKGSVAYRLHRSCGQLQERGLQQLRRVPDALLRDWDSPHLTAVARSIAAEEDHDRRSDRARALFATLCREWETHYAKHTSAMAVYGHYNWNRIGAVPATWLSQLAEPAWLTGPDGPASPRTLSLRTDALALAHGDELAYAAEADPSESRADLVALELGMQTQPTASGLIDELRHLREESPDHAPSAVAVRSLQLLRALALLCPKVADDDPNLDTPVDDMDVRSLRAAFGRARKKQGLLYCDGSWWPATAVVLGSRSLGRFRGTAPRDAVLARLWAVLDVKAPTVADCVEVLRELAEGPLSDEDAGTYLGTLRLMAGLVGADDDLGGVPVWCGARWVTDRPVYVVHDPTVGTALAETHDVWEPRCDISTVASLIGPLALTEIARDELRPVGITDDTLAAGSASLGLLDRAVGLYRELAARDAPDVYAAFDGAWPALAAAQVAIVPDLAISVSTVGIRTTVDVPVAVQSEPAVIAVVDASELGSRETGRALATAFTGVGPDAATDLVKAALLWTAAWSDALAGSSASGATLPRAETADPVEVLAESIETRTTPKPKKRSRVFGEEDAPEPKVTVTRLKSPSSVRIATSGPVEAEPGGPKPPSGGPRPLVKPEVVKDRPEKKRKRRENRVDDQDAETLALEFVRQALRSNSLRDLRNQHGIGADAIDDLGFIELKRERGLFPAKVTLTPSEYARAREEKGDFILAVVAGLLEGMPTEVCFYPDPLSLLKAQAPNGVVLTGLREAGRYRVTFEDIPGDGSA